MKKLILTIASVLLFSSAVFATDNFTIPNAFNSGETISSQKMNENFNLIENKINNLIGNQQNTSSGQNWVRLGNIQIVSGQEYNVSIVNFEMPFGEPAHLTGNCSNSSYSVNKIIPANTTSFDLGYNCNELVYTIIGIWVAGTTLEENSIILYNTSGEFNPRELRVGLDNTCSEDGNRFTVNYISSCPNISAVIATNNYSMKNSVPLTNSKVYSLNGQLISDNWENLYDGSGTLDKSLNEYGLGSGNFWTGVEDLYGNTSSNNCSNWFYDDGGRYAKIGTLDSSTNWLMSSDGACVSRYKLLCACY